MPQPAVPLLGEDGAISHQWWYYLLNLFMRTGSERGISSLTLQQQIESVVVSSAMIGDTPPATPSSFLTSAAMTDLPAPSGVNPFLAALFVMDA